MRRAVTAVQAEDTAWPNALGENTLDDQWAGAQQARRMAGSDRRRTEPTLQVMWAGARCVG